MERKTGYYWVKIYGGWCIGKYSEKGIWNLPGLAEQFLDTDLLEIDERPITREN